MTMVDDILTHAGVKGMKWGVRKDKGHEGQSAKTKKIGKLDKKFEKNAQSFSTTIALYNSAAQKSNDVDIPRINNKPEYRNATFNNPNDKLTQKYHQEHKDAFNANLRAAAKEMGTNASGTREYVITTPPGGGWDVSTRDVAHDIENGEFHVNLKKDAAGRIVNIEINEESLIHGGEDFIEHAGVKGMRWGVRKKQADSGVRRHDQQPSVKLKGTATPVKGKTVKPGDKSSDGITVTSASKKGKDGTQKITGTRKMSEEEMRHAVSMMQLQKQYNQLLREQNPPKVTAGKRFTDELIKIARGVAISQTTNVINKKIGPVIEKQFGVDAITVEKQMRTARIAAGLIKEKD